MTGPTNQAGGASAHAALRDAADRIDRRGLELLDSGMMAAAGLLRRMADEAPPSPDYEHPECGFHWHGRDGMDIPIRDGQPVCPRCELRSVEKRLTHFERRCVELREESLRRGKTVLEQSQKIRALKREIDGVRRQMGEEILRANQAEAELRRMGGMAGEALPPGPAIPPGGNAEDCPRCEGTNPPYPFLCPGHPAQEA
ncbi:hypothetical protein [Streptomyces himastatinicus]|nr:hypothetical protein [Streptomyces himastatinicus]